MHKALMSGAAMLALNFAAAGAALAQQNHEGFRLSAGVGASYLQGDVRFSGGKPSEPLAGAMALGRINLDYQFGEGSGFVVGIGAFSSLGDGIQTAPVRDGNLLVQDSRLNGLSGYGGRIGYAFGNLTPFVGVEKWQRDFTTRQSCPDNPAASVAVGGYCAGGFNLPVATTRAGQRAGSDSAEATAWTLGAELALSRHFSLDARYSDADFGTHVISLAPTGNTLGQVAHPPTDPSQHVRAFAITGAWRF